MKDTTTASGHTLNMNADWNEGYKEGRQQMSKPKNPYDVDDVEHDVWNLAYAAGLRDGAKRERRAIWTWCTKVSPNINHKTVKDFLASRQRNGLIRQTLEFEERKK